MTADDRERKIEVWLDEALSHYSDVQPRPGLEQRILANLEARQRAPRRLWRWAWIPAMAVLLLAGGLWWLNRRPAAPAVVVMKAPPQRTENAGLNPRIITPTAPKLHRYVAPKRVVAAATPAPAPRQEVFPSPSPLSEQERLALSLVRRAPEEALNLAQAQERERNRASEVQLDIIQK